MKSTIGTALVAASIAATTAAASATTITLNNAPLQLAYPPITQTGRVYVPLRGVFEALGASVVYRDGVINATRGNRTVQLRIGSQSAQISGAPQLLDAPPFIQGDATYVPLRFVAQALGAYVEYDGKNDRVGLLDRANVTGYAVPAPTPSNMYLLQVSPAVGAREGNTRPLLSARFSKPVAPESVRIELDDVDVTGAATRSSSGIVYQPPSPLQTMRHRVAIHGLDANRVPFGTGWTFTTLAPTAKAPYLHIDEPEAGMPVASRFSIIGSTVPGASVELRGYANGEFITRTRANANGSFIARMVTNARPGDTVTINVNAQNLHTGGRATQTLHFQANSL